MAQRKHRDQKMMRWARPSEQNRESYFHSYLHAFEDLHGGLANVIPAASSPTATRSLCVHAGNHSGFVLRLSLVIRRIAASAMQSADSF